MRYTTVEDSRAAGVTYHLVPTEEWDRQKDNDTYLPATFENDGFIHCTNGPDELAAVGNRFYKADTRSYMALVLDVEKITSPVRYDDPHEVFPHIYGPLNTAAILGILRANRTDDGTFLSFSPTPLAQ